MSFFLDTNILIYGFSKAADHQEKRQIAEQLLVRRDWYLSAQVLQEFYANITKPCHAFSPLAAMAAIKRITRNRLVCPVDTELVLSAAEIQTRYQLSYWDSAILAAAKRMNCTVLLTEDLNNDQDYGGVVAVNPFLDSESNSPLAQ